MKLKPIRRVGMNAAAESVRSLDDAAFGESAAAAAMTMTPQSENGSGSGLAFQPTPLDLGMLVAENADFVFRSLRRAGLDVASAEDGAQHVFLIASRKLPFIAAGKEKAFLYATARNVAAEIHRRTAKRGEVELVDPEANDESSAALSSTGAAQSSSLDAFAEPQSLDDRLDQQRARVLLDEVLASMPDKLRDVFILSEIEELPASEVAACIEVPVGTVASRLARARQSFDECLTRIKARRAFRRPS